MQPVIARPTVDRERFWWHVLVLAALAILMNTPGLARGRILDDIFVLDKFRDWPVHALFTGGLTISRAESGDFWWIEQDALFTYFRPLLLLTYKLPALLAARPDPWQHLVNLLLHLGTVLLLLATARHVVGHPTSAFLATLLFVSGPQTLLTAQWICGRKDALAGLLLLLAFSLHVRHRRGFASLAFLGALLVAEQVIVFPVLVALWDLFALSPAIERSTSAGRARACATACLPYLAIVLCYLTLRVSVFRGAGLPAPPYFTPPFSPEFTWHALTNAVRFAASLVTSVPYADTAVVAEWTGLPVYPTLGALFLGVLMAGCATARLRRRAPVSLLLLAVVSYLPFVPMAALPFYLYTPSLFFALAVGCLLKPVARPGASHDPIAHRGMIAWLLTIVVINVAFGLTLSWSSIGDALKLPPDLLFKTTQLVERIPPERPILFVDVPSRFPSVLFHFPKLVAAYTGRRQDSLAVICDRPHDPDGAESQITPHGETGFTIRPVGRPYFDTPGRRLLMLFADDVGVRGRTFTRSWYSVLVGDTAQVAAGSNAGWRRGAADGGITALEVHLNTEVARPLVVGFSRGEPYVRLDLMEDAYTVVAPHTPVRDTGVLLRALADRRGVPPGVLRMPDRLIPRAGPKMGLGPLLVQMTDRVPAFRRGYAGFLRYLDDLNSRLARAGGGPFRMSVPDVGAEHFARSIEALGGRSRSTVRSNDFGVTWDSLMETARSTAREALREHRIDRNDPESEMVVSLLALAQIAAVVNMVIPPEYEAGWRARHPELRTPPDSPPAGIPRVYWDGVRNSMAYMYHAGALPWRDGKAANPHEAFDGDHFFSHAWLVAYGLHRHSLFRDGHIGTSAGHLGRSDVEGALLLSRIVGIGYEITSMPMKSGFREPTRTEYLSGMLGPMFRLLGFRSVPWVEAVRDIAVGDEGAYYGAALAVSGLSLHPSDGRLHLRIVDGL